MTKTASTLIARAKEILLGNVAPPSREVYELAEDLWKEGVYSYAGRLYAFLRKSQTAVVELGVALNDSEIDTKLALRHAGCTYDDPDLPVDSRFQAALNILEEIDDLQNSSDPAVLSIAGDIYYRKWENDNQKNTLERAYCYYDQAYRAKGSETLTAQKAAGYAGIQAAFLLDRLAQLELEQAVKVDPTRDSTKTVSGRREDAAEIRRNLIARFTPLAKQPDLDLQIWAFYVSLAEAHFGLQEFGDAKYWLSRAAKLPDIPDRKYENIGRRLVTLYRLMECSASFTDFRRSEAAQVISEFLSNRTKLSDAAFEGLFTGKIGLALSGSGFRACFFHVGVLAKLADLGILRSVEVLSCSSGGSIVGMQYYLELRRLLQRKPDAEIQDSDYVEVVAKVERQLLAGVQRNIQLRSKANPLVNFKILLKKYYSRTDRIGELIQHDILRCGSGEEKDFPQYLRDLFIYPPGESNTFKPKKDNWRRAAKVPVLILNATTINTGHNWQFTASWMGEPAGPINSETDSNLRLRKVRFDEAPKGYGDFSIGKAVIASATEPGLLEPITLDGLYQSTTVRLVDGTLSDPLATSPLLDLGCSFLIVSDASGNTEVLDCPNIDPLSVTTLSERISTSHLRKAQFEHLNLRQQSSMLQEMVFVHLKKDLQSGTADAIGSTELPPEIVTADQTAPLTSYGILKEVQEQLARVRPNFDVFSDTEAYALMTSGYLIMDSEFNRISGSLHQPKNRPDWCFLAIEEQMKKVGESDILRLLAVAHNRFLRIWKLSTALRNLVAAAVPVLVILAIVFQEPLLKFAQGIRDTDSDSLFLVLIVAVYLLTLLILLGAILIGVPLLIIVTILKLTRRDLSLAQILRAVGTLVFGWLLVWIQVLIFDKWYMALGNIKDRPETEAAPPPTSRLAGAIQNLGARIDKEGTASVETINKALDRFQTVEAVSKLFEACGYEVVRFPRDRELNPFQLNLDLYASKGTHQLFADIKTASDSVDWKDASGLQMAASFLKKPDNVSAPEPSNAMLFLIDLPANDALQRYSQQNHVRLIQMDSEGLKRILECRGNTAELQNEAQRLNLFSEEAVSVAT